MASGAVYNPAARLKEVLRSPVAVAQQQLYLTSARQPPFEFRQEGVISFQSAQCLRGGLDLLRLSSKPPLVTRPVNDKRRLYLRHFHLPIFLFCGGSNQRA